MQQNLRRNGQKMECLKEKNEKEKFSFKSLSSLLIIFIEGLFCWRGSSSYSPTLMAAKVKSFFKGFKYISQIFVYKEHEMEIGYPTDVRHVAHIGWDSSSMNAPSWMNEFRTASDFSSSSLSNYGQSRETSWASQDFDHPRGLQPPSGILIDYPRSDVPKAGKKSKRKKGKNSLSLSSTSSRSVKSQASYTTAVEDPEEVRSEYRLV